MSTFAVAFLVLAMNAYVYWYMGSDEVIPPREHFSEFPDQFGSWRCYEREVLDKEIVSNLMVTDYISCGFMDVPNDKFIHLYIGYHERQTRDRETGKAAAIHPPEHCLPGSGWDVIDSRIVPIDVGAGAGAGGEAKRFVIAKGNERALVYFWYNSRGHVIARNWEKIIWMFLDRARYGRTDGSLVRFTIPVRFGDIDAAEATFQEFAKSVTPLLPRFVPN